VVRLLGRGELSRARGRECQAEPESLVSGAGAGGGLRDSWLQGAERGARRARRHATPAPKRETINLGKSLHFGTNLGLVFSPFSRRIESHVRGYQRGERKPTAPFRPSLARG